MRSAVLGPICLFATALALSGCARESAPPTFDTAGFPPADELRDRIDAAVDHTLKNRTLDTGTHNAWQVVHGILPYGWEFEVNHEGKRIGALQWLLHGGVLNGWQLRPGDKGVIAVVDPGSKSAQGHPDQWIGYLSQCGVGPDEKIVVGDKTYTIGDIVRQAEWDIRPGMEATWTLMAFCTYFPSDHKWTAKDGQEWTMERLADMEASAPVSGAACGGTHRLYALSAAVNRYMHETKTPADKLTGGWKNADDVVQECVRKAHSFQAQDGSFSTNFWDRPGTSLEVDTVLHSTGHTLEWLMVTLNQKQLEEPWVTASVVRLCELLEDNRDRDLDCGALYHAARGLNLYRLRRFGPREGSSAPATSAAETKADAQASAPAGAKSGKSE